MTRVDTLELLLDQISVAADTLANFAAHAGQDDDQRAMYSMHAVQAMAEKIGAVASLALRAPTVSAAQHLVGDELAQALADDKSAARAANAPLRPRSSS